MNAEELSQLGVGAADDRQAKIMLSIIESLRREALHQRGRLYECVRGDLMAPIEATGIEQRIADAIAALDAGQEPLKVCGMLERTDKTIYGFEVGH